MANNENSGAATPTEGQDAVSLPAEPPSVPITANQASRCGPLPLHLRDQILFATTAAIAFVALITYCVRTSRWGRDPIELNEQPDRLLNYTIDLNSAAWVEWAQLPGIGSVLARRIVEEREQNGPFRDVGDLARVRGIGPKRIEAMRPFIRVDVAQSSEVNREGDASP